MVKGIDGTHECSVEEHRPEDENKQTERSLEKGVCKYYERESGKSLKQTVI